MVGLYNPADPAVLKLIAMAIEAAERKQVPISMCGQMSGSPLYTMLLLGMGLRQFSVTPSAIPEVKNVCRKRDHRRVRGGGGAGDDDGECPRREKLSEGGSEETRSGDCSGVDCKFFVVQSTAATATNNVVRWQVTRD